MIKEILLKLLKKLMVSTDLDTIEKKIRIGDIQEVVGKDGEAYYLYNDGLQNGIINIRTEEIIINPRKIERIINYGLPK